MSTHLGREAGPPPDFFHQDELTGDWNGVRSRWKGKGFELETSLAQFCQGVSSGGTETSSEYNGTAQAKLEFDLNLKEGKLFAVSFGRYNLLDLLDEEMFAGGGTERFLNIAQIGPLTVLRQVPLVTSAVSLAHVRTGDQPSGAVPEQDCQTLVPPCRAVAAADR